MALLLDSAPRAWTSQEEIHLRLCRKLKELNIRTVLVYAQELPLEIQNRLQQGGADIEVINYARGPAHYYRQLRKLMAKYPITMVHVCFCDYFSLIPWIVRLQGIRAIIFEELNSGMMRATSWKKTLVQFRTTLMAFPMTRVIAISDFVKQDLIRRGIAADRIIVRHLGVDLERFSPNIEARKKWISDYNLDDDELLISTVAVLRPFKNPQTIIEALEILLRRGVKARLFVAGDGEMLPGLQSLGERLGIADRIHWLGYCPDPTSLLQASDIFVLASVGEAFGLVVAEAMACGVPVVGTRSGAIDEIVDDGTTGLLASPEDPRSFGDALEKLARDRPVRQDMGRKSLERIRECFSVDADVENTIRIYNSLWAE